MLDVLIISVLNNTFTLHYLAILYWIFISAKSLEITQYRHKHYAVFTVRIRENFALIASFNCVYLFKTDLVYVMTIIRCVFKWNYFFNSACRLTIVIATMIKIRSQGQNISLRFYVYRIEMKHQKCKSNSDQISWFLFYWNKENALSHVNYNVKSITLKFRKNIKRHL